MLPGSGCHSVGVARGPRPCERRASGACRHVAEPLPVLFRTMWGTLENSRWGRSPDLRRASTPGRPWRPQAAVDVCPHLVFSSLSMTAPVMANSLLSCGRLAIGHRRLPTGGRMPSCPTTSDTQPFAHASRKLCGIRLTTCHTLRPSIRQARLAYKRSS